MPLNLFRFTLLRHWRWALAALLVALLTVAAGRWAGQQELRARMASLRQAADAYTLALHGIIDKYGDLPYVTARHPAVQDLLRHPDDPRQVQAVDRYLADVQRRTGAEELYLVDRQGLTLAASNWNGASSFVGHTYRQRPYFQDALQGRRGLFYGVGLTTTQPGLFIAEPVATQDGILGVLVVKLSLAPLAQAWSRLADPVFLQDARGIVFLSSVSAWLYHAEHPLGADDLDWLREHSQYGARDHFAPLPWRLSRPANLPAARLQTPLDGRARDLLALQTPLPALGWTLTVTGDLGEVWRAREKAQLIALLVSAALLLGLLYWRQRAKRRAEQQRAHLEREQEQKLQHSARLASVGEMASTLAHELNQPLMALSNFALAAQQLAPRQDPALLQEALDGVLEQSTRAADIVRRVRAFINPQRASYEPLAVGELFTHVRALLQPELQRAHTRIIQQPTDTLPRVRGDRILLEQVLINLIQNAVHAMQASPIGQRRIELSACRAGSMLEVMVADHGPGIPADALAQVFQPFFSTRPDGLGLGLKICHTLIEAHGGQMRAANRRQGGAVFTFTLPVHP